MLEALVAALDAREHETCNHSRRVSEYTMFLAARVGLDASLVKDIGYGALLHDIGKIGISDTILLKPSRLTLEEREIIKRHPMIGARILRRANLPLLVTEVVLCHQEWYDGHGYPRGLRGDEITLGARIFSVVDAFDCITSDRPYRKAQPYAVARKEICRHSGTQFDPMAVEAYLSVKEYEWDAIRHATMQALIREENQFVTVQPPGH
ncbi:MAG: HD-GYP domain-containing protein [Acidobacteria bacterium]|nr:HD-GYP domain-containing protein [Acidobacteriota bacterium]